MSLRTALIRLAYQKPELRPDLVPLLKQAEEDDWFRTLLQEEESPQEKSLIAREKAVGFLIDALEQRISELGNNRQMKDWREPGGAIWPSSVRPFTPSRVYAEMLYRRKPMPQDATTKPTDISRVWFEQEYVAGGRIYHKVGYTTQDGRDVIIAKGPWNQSRLAFASLIKGLKQKLSEYKSEKSQIARDLQSF